ncbi:MAG: HPr-rel-A system PqqD family peptide chaperone, partial [Rhodospirillales bacterium]|nr:HPr-rel-A system PqqD family peptide chaperone [Rhodospirillales bacterium]
GPRLLWREWEGQYVTYNDTTGDTHLLDRLAANALLSLEKTPATLKELSIRVAGFSGVEADDDVLAYTQDMIDDFLRRNLIEAGTQ